MKCCHHCHYRSHVIIVNEMQGMCLRISLAQQATIPHAPQLCMPMTALTMLIALLATRSCPASMGSCTPTPSGTALLASFMSEAGTSRYQRLSLHLFHASSALCCIPLLSFHASPFMPPVAQFLCLPSLHCHASSST